MALALTSASTATTPVAPHNVSMSESIASSRCLTVELMYKILSTLETSSMMTSPNGLPRAPQRRSREFAALIHLESDSGVVCTMEALAILLSLLL